MSVDQLREWLACRLSYYLPLWLIILPLAIRWSVDLMPAPILLPASSNRAAEVMFALLAFWLWAVTTNAHSGYLVSTSGSKPGTVAVRKEEFAIVFFFSFLSVAFYVLCFVPQMQGYTFVFPFITVMLAVIALGSPK